MPLSIQTQIEDKLVQILKGMSLAWPPSEMIVARRLPWDSQGDKTTIISPGIVVFPLPPREAAGTNLREDIGYGVGIAFIAPADHSTSENRNRVHAAREAVRRKIIYDRLTIELTGADFCQMKVVEPEVNVPKEAHRYEFSLMAVRCWVREPRT
jgi:hypothetical protein